MASVSPPFPTLPKKKKNSSGGEEKGLALAKVLSAPICGRFARGETGTPGETEPKEATRRAAPGHAQPAMQSLPEAFLGSYKRGRNSARVSPRNTAGLTFGEGSGTTADILTLECH